MPELLIRPETPADIDAITEVTRQAFAHHPHSQQTEHFIIHALRQADVLSLSLVAELQGQVVGHVAFSPVTVEDGSRDWYILGPVSVLPGQQKKGIGSQLIETGLSLLRQRSMAGCVVVGDPAFYQRFGFTHCPALELPGIPKEYFMALPLDSTTAKGRVTYHPSFNATA